MLCYILIDRLYYFILFYFLDVKCCIKSVKVNWKARTWSPFKKIFIRSLQSWTLLESEYIVRSLEEMFVLGSVVKLEWIGVTKEVDPGKCYKKLTVQGCYKKLTLAGYYKQMIGQLLLHARIAPYLIRAFCSNHRCTRTWNPLGRTNLETCVWDARSRMLRQT